MADIDRIRELELKSLYPEVSYMEGISGIDKETPEKKGSLTEGLKKHTNLYDVYLGSLLDAILTNHPNPGEYVKRSMLDNLMIRDISLNEKEDILLDIGTQYMETDPYNRDLGIIPFRDEIGFTIKKKF